MKVKDRDTCRGEYRKQRESEKLREKILKVGGVKTPFPRVEKPRKCLEIFIFVYRIYCRNLTKAEIISIEIGQFSRVSWAKLMEGQLTLHVLLPQP